MTDQRRVSRRAFAGLLGMGPLAGLGRGMVRAVGGPVTGVSSVDHVSSAALSQASPAASPQVVPGASPDAVEGYAYPEWLVDPAWVMANGADPAVRVVALTPAADFAAGHVPGAVGIDWPAFELGDTGEEAITAWEEAAAATLAALGVGPDQTVVAYDGGTLFAARLWWVLDYLGHGDVRILNGGLPAYLAAGGPVEAGPVEPEAAVDPYPVRSRPETLATLDEVLAGLGDEAVVLVDARRPEEYVAGHIPGAINLPYPANAEPVPPGLPLPGPAGTPATGAADDPAARPLPLVWKPAADLRALYADLGVTQVKTVMPYCTTGVRSAVTAFTLRLVGYERVALYTGSWAEWERDPTTPKETGDGSGTPR
ncbi:MAG: sulfurtransferase [Chloroflexota bacterium]|nr:sulfurtransferase [Chloroflexota bacterium]